VTKANTKTNLERLEELIAREDGRGVDIRSMAMRMLTDAYVDAVDLSPEDEAQYVEIASRLIDEVDAATRETVAARLRTCPRVPSALAARLDVRTEPVDDDADTGRRFFAADAGERRRILAEIDAAEAPPPPGDAPRVIASLEQSALAGHPGEFIRELERSLRLPRETAERIVNDLGGEPMVVAARTLGMPLAVLQRILMFVNPAIGHSVRRVYDLSDLYELVTPAAARRLVAAWRTTRAGDPPAASRPAPGPRSFEDSLRAAASSQPFGRKPAVSTPRKIQRTT
jgi:hypothetical protein